jgi:hypothetical protein
MQNPIFVETTGPPHLEAVLHQCRQARVVARPFSGGRLDLDQHPVALADHFTRWESCAHASRGLSCGRKEMRYDAPLPARQRPRSAIHQWLDHVP